ncbi:serine/threonine-protein kinase Nek6-like [Nicotiana tabacum]|uniref:Serine/threonine-protein kinase Nek6-like n=2 Tax=Nicotiana TaxID=4085 RepID=A0A1S4B5K7_TOBAC|nr:PREDICTED: serine/threonine-protein kinase Nek6-like [Nicotiana sylvestris]XP_016484132.1 PREDICTED: serine/threonine-protein kinase Nek6-like [Nicotiana tabacum]
METRIDDYEVIQQLERRAFGTAFLVLHRTDKKKYVLKKIPLAKQTEKSKRAVNLEMNAIAKLSHPYILEYKDAWMDKGSCICTVTNYCEDEDMTEIIRKSRGALFPEEKLCKWLTQLLLALEHLHSNRIHHRDLKLCNIFITKDNDIRLGGFGLAKFTDAEGFASSAAGTSSNMCPELLDGIPYGYKSDIWSLGCCMFEIATHQPPFRAPDKTGLINKINRGSLSPLPIIYSSTMKQIIKSMLRKNSEHRTTAAELLRHQHLQPYLLLCHNPSSAFLPVKSPSSTKERARPSPGKSSSPKYSRDRQLRLKEKRPVLYFDESDNIMPWNLSDNYSTFKAKLETKRVDPTSYSVRISQDSEDSKRGETSEAAVCYGDDQTERLLQMGSTNTPNFSSSRAKTWSEELEHASPEHVKQFEKCDRESCETKELEVLSSPADNEEAETNVVEGISGKPRGMTLSSESCSIKTRCFDEESTSSNSQPAKPDSVAEPRCYATDTENGSESREVSIDCMSTESNGSLVHKDELEKKATMVNDTKQAKKDALQALDDKVSQLKSLAALASNERKDDWGNSTQQRAEALESLLEVCARLLKQEKIDELAGVLKPFGDDGMSSRETAIWLTKSLMTAQKLAKGS